MRGIWVLKDTHALKVASDDMYRMLSAWWWKHVPSTLLRQGLRQALGDFARTQKVPKMTLQKARKGATSRAT